jgi:hypothetical protein
MASSSVSSTASARAFAGSHGPFGAPILGPWLSRRCCQAFHHGFVEPLAQDPAPVLLGLVHGAEPAKASACVP